MKSFFALMILSLVSLLFALFAYSPGKEISNDYLHLSHEFSYDHVYVLAGKGVTLPNGQEG